MANMTPTKHLISEFNQGQEYGTQGVLAQDFTNLVEAVTYAENKAEEVPPVVDNLISTSTTDALSANQGRVLKNAIDGKTIGFAYDTISAMVTSLNTISQSYFNIASNLYIVQLDVPDFWVTEVMTTSVQYTYTTDQALIDAVDIEPLQIGYFKISKLETEKVDLTNLVTLDTAQTITGLKNFDYEKIKISVNNNNNDYRHPLTSPYATTTDKRLLLGVPALQSRYTNYNSNVYMENGKLYTNNVETANVNQTYFRLYTTLGQLGLTAPSTIVEVMNYLITNSLVKCKILISNDNNNNFTDAPDSYGTLEIVTGTNVLRVSIKYTKQIGTTGTARTWLGNIIRSGNTVDIIEWAEVIDNISTQTISGEKSFSNHIKLTGGKSSNSTGNTSQIIFYNENSAQQFAISSNNNAMVINPSTTSTTGQMVISLGTNMYMGNGTSDLGTSSAKWRNLYIGGFAKIGDCTVTSGNGVMQFTFD